MKKSELTKSLIFNDICQERDIEGVSEAEIEAIEKRIGHRLPATYCEFLLAAGRRAGDFLSGTDIFISALADLQDEAIDLLRENNQTIELPLDAYVFSMHQGYEFTYFNISEGEDPPVYQYVEGNASPKLCWASFSDFIKDAIKQHSKNK